MKTVNPMLQRRTRLAVIAPLAALFCGAIPAFSAPILGTAQNFAVLGAASVSNTNPTTIKGDLGVYPGTSIIGGPPLVSLAGTVHQTDAVAQQAQTDALNAYTGLAAMSVGTNLTGTDLGGLILNAGVYHFDSSAQLTGTLTLDALNVSDAIFVFQIESTLTTASNATVNVINGGSNIGVFWQIGSSATLGTGTLFAGNILADQSVTLNTAAKILCGRAFALNAAVTMDNNTVSNDCANGGDYGTGRTDYGSIGFGGPDAQSGTPSIPEPSSMLPLVFGLLVSATALKRVGRRAKAD